jgi:HEAT repeat protein
MDDGVMRPDPRALVARLEDLPAIFRVQGEILAYGRAAVPALAAFLLGRSSVLPEARAAAAECLGALGGEEAIAALVGVLTHHDMRSLTPAVRMAEETVRNAAARALGRRQAREAVPALLAALGEQRLIGAGAALAAMREMTALPGLVRLLEEPSHNEAAELLASFGTEAVPALCAALNERTGGEGFETPSSAQRRSLAAELLGRAGGTEAEAALRRRVDDPSPRVRIAATLALARLGSTGAAFAAVAAALADDDVTVQSEMVQILAAAGREAGPSLARLVEDDTALPRARSVAAWLLARSPDPAAVPSLIRALAASDPQLRCAVVRALAAFPESAEAAEAIRAARRDPSPAVRDTARRLLRRTAP